MEQSVVVGLVTFFLGLILGHRLSLGRDRRKEFNEISQPIRAILMKEKQGPRPLIAGLGALDADQLEFALPYWERRSFRASFIAYQKAKDDAQIRNSIGEVLYKSTDEIVHCVDRLLRYTRRK